MRMRDFSNDARSKPYQILTAPKRGDLASISWLEDLFSRTSRALVALP
jgi:hypothetical protein